MDKERYSNDPITEALLEIGISSLKDTAHSDLREAFTELSDSYSVRADLVNFTTKASFSSEPSATASKDAFGLVLISNEEKKKIEVRKDAFIYGQLAPYPGWDEFSREARRGWDVFRRCTQPDRIPQINLRFINRFHFPVNNDIRKYLKVFPVVSDELSKYQQAFFLQTQMMLPDFKAVAVINEATVEAAIPDHTSILLDVNIMRMADIHVSDEGLWHLIANFRKVKNEVFESLITDETRRALRR